MSKSGRRSRDQVQKVDGKTGSNLKRGEQGPFGPCSAGSREPLKVVERERVVIEAGLRKRRLG